MQNLRQGRVCSHAALCAVIRWRFNDAPGTVYDILLGSLFTASVRDAMQKSAVVMSWLAAMPLMKFLLHASARVVSPLLGECGRRRLISAWFKAQNLALINSGATVNPSARLDSLTTPDLQSFLQQLEVDIRKGVVSHSLIPHDRLDIVLLHQNTLTFTQAAALTYAHTARSVNADACADGDECDGCADPRFEERRSMWLH